MIPEIYINLHYDQANNKIEILGFSKEQEIFLFPIAISYRSIYLPDMISDDTLIMTWLKEMNLPQDKIDEIYESLTELGMSAGRLLNKINL